MGALRKYILGLGFGLTAVGTVAMANPDTLYVKVDHPKITKNERLSEVSLNYSLTSSLDTLSRELTGYLLVLESAISQIAPPQTIIYSTDFYSNDDDEGISVVIDHKDHTHQKVAFQELAGLIKEDLAQLRDLRMSAAFVKPLQGKNSKMESGSST